MSGTRKGDFSIVVLDSASSAAHIRAAADFLIKFSEREKPRKTLSKSESEALIRAVASAKSLSRYIFAFDKNEQAAGMLLLAACPGVYGEWGLISELFIEKSQDAALAETLLAAAVDYAASARLRHVASLLPSADEQSNPDRKTLAGIVERLGFEKGETTLVEKYL